MLAPDWIIVTAYNEGDRLAATLRALRTVFPTARTLVADDGSQDDTAAVARAQGVEVLSSARRLHKGGASTLAARWILERWQAPNGVLLLCDADLGESAAALSGLLEPLASDRADLVVGAFARRSGGGLGLAVGFARWALQRRCGLQLTAPISGQRALRREALLAALPFADAFGMEMAMTIDVVRAGFRIVEVPLALEHRATGRTLAGFVHRGRQLADFVRVYATHR